MKTRAIIVAATVGALVPMSGVAVSAVQDTAPPALASAPLVIQVGVDLIQIDATITDKKGRPVTDGITDQEMNERAPAARP